MAHLSHFFFQVCLSISYSVLIFFIGRQSCLLSAHYHDYNISVFPFLKTYFEVSFNQKNKFKCRDIYVIPLTSELTSEWKLAEGSNEITSKTIYPSPLLWDINDQKGALNRSHKPCELGVEVQTTSLFQPVLSSKIEKISNSFLMKVSFFKYNRIIGFWGFGYHAGLYIEHKDACETQGNLTKLWLLSQTITQPRSKSLSPFRPRGAREEMEGGNMRDHGNKVD